MYCKKELSLLGKLGKSKLGKSKLGKLHFLRRKRVMLWVSKCQSQSVKLENTHVWLRSVSLHFDTLTLTL